MARQVLENGVVLPAEYSDDWYDDMTTNLTKLDDVIGSDSEKLSSSDVGAAALSNNYNDLDNLPTIPTVNDATLTIQKNGIDVQTFTANASSNVTANITVPTKTSDITNDSNFVDTSNSAVASGITSAKVTSYDSHIADNDIHVTTADKTSWNTVTAKANDSDVVHKSGDETVGGIKNFTDYTYIRALNFTNEVASTSSSSSAVMPIVTTVTYTDSSPSQSARLNLRITADGTKSLYPHESNQYALGLTSRKWSEVHSLTYYYGSSDTEFSDKFVTTDTAQTITGAKTFTDNISTKKIISNVAQLHINARSNADSVAVIAGASAADGGGIWLYGKNSAYNSNVTIQVYDTYDSTYHTVRLNMDGSLTPTVANNGLGSSSFKWRSFNGLNPSSLGMPDLSNGIDISSYITVPNAISTYTPSVNGWISIVLKSTSGALGLFVYQGDFANGHYSQTSLPGENEPCLMLSMPVTKEIAVNIATKGSNAYVYSAKFYPCLGNV